MITRWRVEATYNMGCGGFWPVRPCMAWSKASPKGIPIMFPLDDMCPCIGSLIESQGSQGPSLPCRHASQQWTVIGFPGLACRIRPCASHVISSILWSFSARDPLTYRMEELSQAFKQLSTARITASECKVSSSPASHVKCEPKSSAQFLAQHIATHFTVFTLN